MSDDLLKAEEVVVIESPSNVHKLKFINFNGQILSLEGCSRVEFIITPNKPPTLELTYSAKNKMRKT